MNRILIVDDAVRPAEMLRKLLSLCGFEVACAADGEDGLALLEPFAPQVIILDLEMAVLDGYGFLEALRLRPDCCALAVIVFTAALDPELARLRDLGMSQFCAKGETTFNTLLKHVHDCMPVC